MGRNQLAVLAIATVAAAGALITGSAHAETVPGTVSAPPAGHWHARTLPGLRSLNNGKAAAVDAVSCAPRAPGNCAAIGHYEAADLSDRAFVADENRGSWGGARPVPAPDLAATLVALRSVSCRAPGNCVAVGNYVTPASPATGYGFFASEGGGSWDLTDAISGGAEASDVNAVSCVPASRGDYCAVAGSVSPVSNGTVQPRQPVVWDEANGSWGLPQVIQGLSDFGLSRGDIQVMSCPSPGNCGAVGVAQDASGQSQLFLVDERSGSWGRAQPVPEMSMLRADGSADGSISCAAAGNCTLAGTYFAPTDNPDRDSEQVFDASEAGGQWGSPQQVPGTGALNIGGLAQVGAVSCGGPGECAVAGFYTDQHGNPRAFTADERRGTWQPVHTLTGTGIIAGGPDSAATTVSCATAGNCAAGGFFDGPGGTGVQAFTASEVNGTWGSAQVPPGSAALNTGKNASLTSVSCAAPGSCAAGGEYFASPDPTVSVPLLADSSPATTALIGLSMGKIRLGHEQAAKVSVNVIGRTGGRPGGTVTVKAGGTTVCVIKLAAAKGSCRLAARALKPGSYRLTARYGGDASYAAATSTARLLRVTR